MKLTLMTFAAGLLILVGSLHFYRWAHNNGLEVGYVRGLSHDHWYKQCVKPDGRPSICMQLRAMHSMDYDIAMNADCRIMKAWQQACDVEYADELKKWDAAHPCDNCEIGPGEKR